MIALAFLGFFGLALLGLLSGKKTPEKSNSDNKYDFNLTITDSVVMVNSEGAEVKKAPIALEGNRPNGFSLNLPDGRTVPLIAGQGGGFVPGGQMPEYESEQRELIEYAKSYEGYYMP